MSLHTALAERTISVDRVAGYLAGAAGAEKADDLVRRTARELGHDPQALCVAHAMDVLEKIAATPGLLGIAARFARSRMILDQSTPTTR